jgi:NitT/TauT family transport system permease protein
MVVVSARLDDDLADVDDLVAAPERPGRGRRWWRAIWPRLAAVAGLLLLWELVVLLHLRPTYVLPPPDAVLARLVRDMGTPEFYRAIGTTLGRAATGYAIALVIGTVLGVVLSRSRVLRIAFGSFITGLQSMPSVAWFPFAILLFNVSEGAILFVVVLGAAPSIANGIISGIDHIPPMLLRAAQVMGARGVNLYRRVILPAALPGFLAGLKQGWAFAWRSLMAGELLVIIGGQTSIGVRLQFAREFSDAEGLLASMLVVLAVGILVDLVVFGWLENAVRARRGLVDTARD